MVNTMKKNGKDVDAAEYKQWIPTILIMLKQHGSLVGRRGLNYTMYVLMFFRCRSG